MRRIIALVTVALVMAMMLALSGAALAQGKGPEPNAHNCGGTSSFQTRELLGSGRAFGGVVSDVAQEQQADNVTGANCENNSGQNP